MLFLKSLVLAICAFFVSAFVSVMVFFLQMGLRAYLPEPFFDVRVSFFVGFLGYSGALWIGSLGWMRGMRPEFVGWKRLLVSLMAGAVGCAVTLPLTDPRWSLTSNFGLFSTAAIGFVLVPALVFWLAHFLWREKPTTP